MVEGLPVQPECDMHKLCKLLLGVEYRIAKSLTVQVDGQASSRGSIKWEGGDRFRLKSRSDSSLTYGPFFGCDVVQSNIPYRLGWPFESVLDQFIPGYPLLSRFLKAIGLDVIRFCVVPLFALAGLHFLYQSFSHQLFDFFTSSVRVVAPDPLFEDTLKFLIRKKGGWWRLRCLQVTTSPNDPRHPSFDDLLIPAVDGTNYATPNSLTPVRPKPDDQYLWFYHKMRLFRFQRSKQLARTGLVIEETIKLTVLSSSIQPVTDLIKEIHHQWLSTMKPETAIFRPAPKASRERGGYPWVPAARRQIRSLETVALDERQKKAVLADMESFWAPDAKDWYSSCGIPHRRGYLFWRPPGTGKSSFTFAVAGKFDVDLCCVGLSDKNLTEEELLHLVSCLPRQSILLLEDMDTTSAASGS